MKSYIQMLRFSLLYGLLEHFICLFSFDFFLLSIIFFIFKTFLPYFFKSTFISALSGKNLWCASCLTPYFSLWNWPHYLAFVHGAYFLKYYLPDVLYDRTVEKVMFFQQGRTLFCFFHQLEWAADFHREFCGIRPGLQFHKE